MYCSSYGQDLADNVRFCTECGREPSAGEKARRSPSTFVDSIEAALEADGWKTRAVEGDDGLVEIGAADPETETRRLVLVVPDPDATVGVDHADLVCARADRFDATETAIATQGTYAAEGRRRASEQGVRLLDPGATTVTDLCPQFCLLGSLAPRSSDGVCRSSRVLSAPEPSRCSTLRASPAKTPPGIRTLPALSNPIG